MTSIETGTAPQPTFELSMVGPEEAKTLLEMNLRNRAINDRAVSEYARAMTLGEWQFDGAPIRLADDGQVLDGQHRLQAIIESNTTQQFLIVYGVDKSAQDVMDTGRKRTFSDVLHLEGYENSKMLASVVLMHYRWVNGLRADRLFHPGGTTISSSSATASVVLPQNRTLLEHLHKNEWIKDHLRPGQQFARFSGITPRIAVFSRMMIDTVPGAEDDAEFFFDRLKTGMDLSIDSPILVLRNKFAEIKSDALRGQSHNPTLQLWYIFKAWNFYREGKPMVRMLVKSGGKNPDKYPEPV
jgi:hypothetical protein